MKPEVFTIILMRNCLLFTLVWALPVKKEEIDHNQLRFRAGIPSVISVPTSGDSDTDSGIDRELSNSAARAHALRLSRMQDGLVPDSQVEEDSIFEFPIEFTEPMDDEYLDALADNAVQAQGESLKRMKGQSIEPNRPEISELNAIFDSLDIDAGIDEDDASDKALDLLFLLYDEMNVLEDREDPTPEMFNDYNQRFKKIVADINSEPMYSSDREIQLFVKGMSSDLKELYKKVLGSNAKDNITDASTV